MASISESLAAAVAHHRAGRLPEAEQIYRRILEADPLQADALHLLGVLAHQQGKHELAVDHIGSALRLKEGRADFHSNLGEAQRALGRLADAVACYRRAVELKPDFADAHYNMGVALQSQGEPTEAIACYRRALQLRPEHAQAHYNLGNALQAQGQLVEAIASYRQALRLNPDYAEAYVNLGQALQGRRQIAEAISCYRRTLQLQPDSAEAHGNLGNALCADGRVAEALGSYGQALRLKPDSAETHNNLGRALQCQGQLTRAIAYYRRALQIQPHCLEAQMNLGSALEGLGKTDEAIACYRQALQLHPRSAEVYNDLGSLHASRGEFEAARGYYDQAVRLQPSHVEARWNRGVLWLLHGDLERGLPEYEWRSRKKESPPPRPFQQPLWDGSAFRGRTILLHAEQGFGDTLQFIRYVALVKERGGRVVLECQPILRDLIAGCKGFDKLAARDDPLPDFDIQAPLLSLPWLLKTTLATIPANVPYLFAHPEQVKPWRHKLGSIRELKVGVAWQGSPNTPTNSRRSLPLACLEPLAGVESVRLFSLQKDASAEQLAAAAHRLAIADLGSRLGTFADTAALLRNLDLVISVDTSVAHCAGALGVPTWVMLPYVPEWRWLLGREDSPWYPGMRLFRQQRLHEWDEVIERMARELRELRLRRY